MLDAKIRKATGGAKSLDDVMRAAYQKFSGPKGYTPEQFRAVAEEVAGTSLKAFWESAVEGASELDYTEALATLGLRFKSAAAAPADRPAKPWLGINTRNDNGRLVISQVQRDSPADRLGSQRRRRDPGDRRLPRARRSAGEPARAVQGR